MLTMFQHTWQRQLRTTFAKSVRKCAAFICDFLVVITQPQQRSTNNSHCYQAVHIIRHTSAETSCLHSPLLLGTNFCLPEVTQGKPIQSLIYSHFSHRRASFTPCSVSVICPGLSPLANTAGQELFHVRKIQVCQTKFENQSTHHIVSPFSLWAKVVLSKFFSFRKQ